MKKNNKTGIAILLLILLILSQSCVKTDADSMGKNAVKGEVTQLENLDEMVAKLSSMSQEKKVDTILNLIKNNIDPYDIYILINKIDTDSRNRLLKEFIQGKKYKWYPRLSLGYTYPLGKIIIAGTFSDKMTYECKYPSGKIFKMGHKDYESKGSIKWEMIDNYIYLKDIKNTPFIPVFEVEFVIAARRLCVSGGSLGRIGKYNLLICDGDLDKLVKEVSFPVYEIVKRLKTLKGDNLNGIFERITKEQVLHKKVQDAIFDIIRKDEGDADLFRCLKRGGDDIVDDLLKRFKTERNETALIDIIQVLSSIGNKKALGAFIICAGYKNKEIKEHCYLALKDMPDKKSLKILARGMHDRDKFIRSLVVSTLCKINDPESVRLLIKMYNMRKKEFGYSIVYCLHDVGDKQAIPLLRKAAKDKNKHLASAAKRALQRIKTK
jgi:hypothetical protein